MDSEIVKLNGPYFRWVNEPSDWKLMQEALIVKTEKNTDFWQGTWYDFYRHTGHVYGLTIVEDFTFEVCLQLYVHRYFTWIPNYNHTTILLLTDFSFAHAQSK